MTCLSLSTPCVKTGFVPYLNFSPASGETRVRAQAVETAFNSLLGGWFPIAAPQLHLSLEGIAQAARVRDPFWRNPHHSQGVAAEERLLEWVLLEEDLFVLLPLGCVARHLAYDALDRRARHLESRHVTLVARVDDDGHPRPLEQILKLLGGLGHDEDDVEVFGLRKSLHRAGQPFLALGDEHSDVFLRQQVRDFLFLFRCHHLIPALSLWPSPMSKNGRGNQTNHFSIRIRHIPSSAFTSATQ